MKSIGPRSDSHVHDGAGLPAIFCLGIFLEVEFLDGVDGQDRRPICERTRHIGDGTGVIEIDVDNAVEHPAGFIGTNVVAALRPGSAARLDHHARAQCQQALVVAAIQRHIVDVRVVESAAQRGVGGFHQRNRFGDGDRLNLIARLHRQVYTHFFTYLQHDVLALDGLETFGLDANLICAWIESGSVVLSCVIRRQGFCHASVCVRDSHRGAGYDASSLVCDRPEDTARTAL